MKLQKIALAGLVGLAGFAAAANDASAEAGVVADTTWDNDAASTYICNGLNIEHCDSASSTCHWVEACPKGCYDTGNGALCVDRASITKKIAAANTRRDQPVPASIDGASGGTKQCTDDRRGVLTCNSGFCAVQPGDWCKDGWSCRTECNCCKKNGGKHSAMTFENPPQIERRLPQEDKCTPGYYDCDSTNDAYLRKCDAQGEWQISAYCGRRRGDSCCRGSNDGKAGLDYRCDCRNIAPGLPGPVEEQSIVPVKARMEEHSTLAEVETGKRPSATLDPTVSDSIAGNCTPGQFWCMTPGWDWVIVCNQNGNWQRYLYCGKTSEQYGCCRSSSIPSGYSVCDCRGLPGGPPALVQDPRSIKPLGTTSDDDLPLVK